jgi:glucose/arabinose dehydrogenase
MPKRFLCSGPVLGLWSKCAVHVAIVLAIATPAAAQLQTVPYVSGLSAPVEFVQDPSNRSVQFVVEQGGRIRVIQGGVLLPAPFLDISADISSGGERGLLGLAFAPDYAVSRRFFVDLTDPNGNTVVARFKRSAGDPLSADPTTRFDLRWHGGQRFIAQPFANHNGGHLAFGPDWYLYVAVGDGGSSDDPFNTAQRPDTLLGKLLRINVLVDDGDPEGYVVPSDNPFVSGAPIAALPEIWAFGLRNPWKFSFDEPVLGGNGAMLIADVGQNAFEEVDYQPYGVGGRNYGWRVREGVHDHIASPGPAYLPLVQPIVEYDHTVGNSITGGFVYRGYSLGAAYRGRYFYGDFGTGRVWSVPLIPIGGGQVSVGSGSTEHTAELGGAGTVGNVSSFGMDAAGELYIVSYFSGRILKIISPRDYGSLAPSDIDGDHKTDPVAWRPSTGAWLGTRSSDGGSLNRQWGAGYDPYNDLPVPGDYDGDGRTDIAVWRPSSGTWYIVRSSDGVQQTFQWGRGSPPYNDVPVPGDYDGDRITDLAVWRPGEGNWYIRRSSDGGVVIISWGGGYLPYNDTPVPADYDGDGKTDVAIWRPSDGTWWVNRSSDGGVTSLQWGAGYAPYFDIPVTGDFDGDGKSDMAIWRPFQGKWYVRQSATGTAVIVSWGAGYAPYNDVPVPGDYDGDGKTDMAVWRPNEGCWYVLRSSNGTLLQLFRGEAGDVP